jgi:hypothetical protein
MVQRIKAEISAAARPDRVLAQRPWENLQPLCARLALLESIRMPHRAVADGYTGDIAARILHESDFPCSMTVCGGWEAH